MNVGMIKRIEEFFTPIQKAAGLSKVHPGQFSNANEMGMDPCGRWSKVVLFKGQKVHYHVQDREKVPFHATIVLFTCADGSGRVKPSIIHQGPEGYLRDSAIKQFGGNGLEEFEPGWNIMPAPAPAFCAAPAIAAARF
mmetsp:Transcript_35120/g.88745  ORF Transcript_35120/g.88745 Transcript_35120/m.88745 type:complete len:138 (-) Transcript_35120:277-690(-)